MLKERLLGEPSAAESCLMPNSSDESDEGPSETLSQAKRRRVEAAEYQLDQGQLRIAEAALQEYVDDLTDDFDGAAKLNAEEYAFFKNLLQEEGINDVKAMVHSVFTQQASVFKKPERSPDSDAFTGRHPEATAAKPPRARRSDVTAPWGWEPEAKPPVFCECAMAWPHCPEK